MVPGHPDSHVPDRYSDLLPVNRSGPLAKASKAPDLKLRKTKDCSIVK
jgi:hypothetical protein